MKQYFLGFYAMDLYHTSARILVIDSETILIVDNSSDDKIKEIILEYKENPQKVVRSQFNVEIKDKSIIDILNSIEFGDLFSTADIPVWEEYDLEHGDVIKLKDFQL